MVKKLLLPLCILFSLPLSGQSIPWSLTTSEPSTYRLGMGPWMEYELTSDEGHTNALKKQFSHVQGQGFQGAVADIYGSVEVLETIDGFEILVRDGDTKSKAVLDPLASIFVAPHVIVDSVPEIVDEIRVFQEVDGQLLPFSSRRTPGSETITVVVLPGPETELIVAPVLELRWLGQRYVRRDGNYLAIEDQRFVLLGGDEGLWRPFGDGFAIDVPGIPRGWWQMELYLWNQDRQKRVYDISLYGF